MRQHLKWFIALLFLLCWHISTYQRPQPCKSEPQVPVAKANTVDTVVVEMSAASLHGDTSATQLASFVYPNLYHCPTREGTTEGYHSQSHEDWWLWDNIFSKLPEDEQWGGTFIEIGALDGISISNTLYFEKRWDWRGLLIEGHPPTQRAMFSNQARRSNSVMFPAAICHWRPDGTSEALAFTRAGGGIATAITSSNPKFMKGWHQDHDDSQSLYSHCLPLQALIDSTAWYHIDLLSLDVEGAELLVLKTIDFHVTHIRVILVELDGDNPSKDSEVRNFLTASGFVPYHANIRDACRPNEACTSNEVFVNPLYTQRQPTLRLQYGTSEKC